MNTRPIREFTLWARGILTKEISELLRQAYGLKQDGKFLPLDDLPALKDNAEIRETREHLEKLLADEQDAGIKRDAAVAKLVKETAFTNLNRLVALKMLEHPDRKLIRRAALAGYPEPNGFKMYAAEHPEDGALYEQGATPQDELDEGPRDRAYRHFLLWQYSTMANEVRVLFDPDNLASRLFPRPKVLRNVINRVNGKELKDAWAPGNEETIGWVYQAFNAEELERAFAEVRLSKKKFSKEDIPSVTQLFTPRVAVRFLVENTLGRLWLSMHPDSDLEGDLEYFVRPASVPTRAPLKPVREIRILDPACGTMHFGLLAFDLLVKMYQEEANRAGQEGWPAEPSVTEDNEIPSAILANNLFGIDIDLRAVQLSALALYLRAKSQSRDTRLTESNLACADVAIFRGPHRSRIAGEMELPRGLSRQLFEQFCDALDEASLMGSLVRLEQVFERKLRADELKQAIDAYVRKKASEGMDESYFSGEATKGLRLLDVLTRRYDVVFTNPPYISARKMNPEMSRFVKAEYKAAKGDLYAGFIQRCLELTSTDGLVGMLTMHSFMFISSYEKLRDLITSNAAVETAAHFGPALFSVGNPGTLQTVAFVLRQETFANARRGSVGVYFRLVKERNAEAKRMAFEQAVERHRLGASNSRVYEYKQGDFAAIAGNPWTYWILPHFRTLFNTMQGLKEVAVARQGLATADNRRFIRFWWEIGRQNFRTDCSEVEETECSSTKWYPHMKGGGPERWWAYRENVVNWFNNGAEIKAHICFSYSYLDGNWEWVAKNTSYYFRPAITYSAISGSGFAGRLMPQGFSFDCAGDCLFPHNEQHLLAYLGILNSKVFQGLLSFVNPTLNVNTRDLDRVPVPRIVGDSLESLVRKTVSFKQEADAEDETSYDFVSPPDWHLGQRAVADREGQVFQLEQEIDEEVCRLYKISEGEWKAIESELAAGGSSEDSADSDENQGDSEEEPETDQPISRADLAMRWVGYAVGIALGRFQPGVAAALACGQFEPETAAKLRRLSDVDGIMVLEEGHPDDLAQRVLEILNEIYGDRETENIIRTATRETGPLRGVIESYLLGEFFRDHVKLRTALTN